MRLLPREEKFFHFFNDQAQLIVQASRLLRESTEKGNSAVATAATEINKFEQKGDEIIHEIFTKLNQTFITPLDPEDIHSLGSYLDDVLDALEEAAHRIVAFKIEPIPPAVVEFAKLIEACAMSMSKAFTALSGDRLLLEHCIEINRLEDSADRLLRTAVVDLFDNEKDPIRLIKLKEIYELLEETTDRAEDVADVLQNVIVKNS
jgi:hypothetical protein